MNAARTWLVWMCSGCAWVTAPEHDQARDRDGDGVLWPTDCDDQDPTVGEPTSWFYDSDLDGYGAGTPVASCEALPQHSNRDDDCDDGDAAVHPDEVERCNGADDCRERRGPLRARQHRGAQRQPVLAPQPGDDPRLDARKLAPLEDRPRVASHERKP